MNEFTEKVVNEMVSQTWREIDHVQKILSTKLSDEPEKLIGDLENIEAWNSRMGFLLADANSWLERARAQSIPDKEGKTEFERKILMEDAVTPIKRHRDVIESICDSIKQRLILGESVLSYQKQFAERKQINNKPWGG
jgi:hypothetical protein